MARIDKLERARQEGMSYALEVARKKGIEGLEEELRMRGVTGIPIGVSRSAVDKVIENIKNQTLDTVNILTAMTLHDEFVFYKRYILGLWAVAEGIIYDMFSEEKHVISEPQSYVGRKYVSVDYGTQNATVFLLWEKNRKGQWVATKEYYYSGRDEAEQKTDGEYADNMEEFVSGIEIESIIVDPPAASFITELKKRGFKVKKAKNDVLDGIRFVGNLLNLGVLLFLKDCKETIKEFGSYIWDEKAIERGEDKPVKQHDHCMDAVRYFAYTITRRERKWS